MGLFFSGAGMSGLTFAIALQKFAPDVTYELYESASTLSEVGAGISAQDRSWSIMQALGLEDLLLQVAGTDDHRCECADTYVCRNQISWSYTKLFPQGTGRVISPKELNSMRPIPTVCFTN